MSSKRTQYHRHAHSERGSSAAVAAAAAASSSSSSSASASSSNDASSSEWILLQKKRKQQDRRSASSSSSLSDEFKDEEKSKVFHRRQGGRVEASSSSSSAPPRSTATAEGRVNRELRRRHKSSSSRREQALAANTIANMLATSSIVSPTDVEHRQATASLNASKRFGRSKNAASSSSSFSLKNNSENALPSVTAATTAPLAVPPRRNTDWMHEFIVSLSQDNDDDSDDYGEEDKIDEAVKLAEDDDVSNRYHQMVQARDATTMSTRLQFMLQLLNLSRPSSSSPTETTTTPTPTSSLPSDTLVAIWPPSAILRGVSSPTATSEWIEEDDVNAPPLGSALADSLRTFTNNGVSRRVAASGDWLSDGRDIVPTHLYGLERLVNKSRASWLPLWHQSSSSSKDTAATVQKKKNDSAITTLQGQNLAALQWRMCCLSEAPKLLAPVSLNCGEDDAWGTWSVKPHTVQSNPALAGDSTATTTINDDDDETALRIPVLHLSIPLGIGTSRLEDNDDDDAGEVDNEEVDDEDDVEDVDDDDDDDDESSEDVADDESSFVIRQLLSAYVRKSDEDDNNASRLQWDDCVTAYSANADFDRFWQSNAASLRATVTALDAMKQLEDLSTSKVVPSPPEGSGNIEENDDDDGDDNALLEEGLGGMNLMQFDANATLFNALANATMPHTQLTRMNAQHSRANADFYASIAAMSSDATADAETEAIGAISKVPLNAYRWFEHCNNDRNDALRTELIYPGRQHIGLFICEYILPQGMTPSEAVLQWMSGWLPSFVHGMIVSDRTLLIVSQENLQLLADDDRRFVIDTDVLVRNLTSEEEDDENGSGDDDDNNDKQQTSPETSTAMPSNLQAWAADLLWRVEQLASNADTGKLKRYLNGDEEDDGDFDLDPVSIFEEDDEDGGEDVEALQDNELDDDDDDDDDDNDDDDNDAEEEIGERLTRTGLAHRVPRIPKWMERNVYDLTNDVVTGALEDTARAASAAAIVQDLVDENMASSNARNPPSLPAFLATETFVSYDHHLLDTLFAAYAHVYVNHESFDTFAPPQGVLLTPIVRQRSYRPPTICGAVAMTPTIGLSLLLFRRHGL